MLSASTASTAMLPKLTEGIQNTFGCRFCAMDRTSGDIPGKLFIY